MVDTRGQANKLLSKADCRRLKVLIVDPNPYMRGIVADALRRLNIGELVASASSDEAYEACHYFRPNFIITDWEAGKISGLEFTRLVRRGERNLPRETPIILLASTVAHDQLMAARQAGINELLLKPISVLALKTRIEEIILRPRKFIDSRHYVGPCRRRKQSEKYYGPLRRLSDEPEVEAERKSDPARDEKLRALVAQLTNYAVRDTDDNTGLVRGLYKLLTSHQSGIDGLGDEIISRIWGSAQRYIEGVGMTATYDPEVVLSHFQSIASIMDMPEDAHAHRNAVISDLERLVTKKIHTIDCGRNPSQKHG